MDVILPNAPRPEGSSTSPRRLPVEEVAAINATMERDPGTPHQTGMLEGLVLPNILEFASLPPRVDTSSDIRDWLFEPEGSKRSSHVTASAMLHRLANTLCRYAEVAERVML